MMHDLETEPRGGRYFHRCKQCRATKETAGPKWFAECYGPPCIHLGEQTGETILCDGCRGKVRIKLFACAVHGSCLPNTSKGKETTPEVPKCDGCAERE